MRIVVPQTPGGASDTLARVLATKLTARWGQTVVVENKAGAVLTRATAVQRRPKLADGRLNARSSRDAIEHRHRDQCLD